MFITRNWPPPASRAEFCEGAMELLIWTMLCTQTALFSNSSLSVQCSDFHLSKRSSSPSSPVWSSPSSLDVRSVFLIHLRWSGCVFPVVSAFFFFWNATVWTLSACFSGSPVSVHFFHSFCSSSEMISGDLRSQVF